MSDAAEEFRDKHIERIIKATSDLYKQENSICKKCHDMPSICCLFCFCPYYDLVQCPGVKLYTFTKTGIKDCSDCTIPHTEEFVKQHLKSIIL